MMKRSLLVTLAVLWATDSQAIVIRHDREDAAYRELATGYSMVCQVGGGMGTLIHPRWILTAAHVADSLPRSDPGVRIGGRAVAVESVSIHPGYALEGEHRDLALIQLGEPVDDVEPARLYRHDDEIGKQVTFVGNGDTGTGESGPARGKPVMRAAHNTVTDIRPGWITFVFDEPPQGEDLEGISGPGDSGGPALIEVDDEQFILGVSAFNEGKPVCTYGTIEHYSRVSDELTWIEGVMTGKITGSGEPRLMRYSDDGEGQASVVREAPDKVEIPEDEDARLWSVVARLTDAINNQATTAYLDLFSERLIRETDRAGDPLTGMLEFMAGVEEARGPITTFHPLDRQGYDIPDSAFPMRPVTFHLRDGTSGFFGLTIDDSGKVDHLSLFVRAGLCEEEGDCSVARSLKETSADR